MEQNLKVNFTVHTRTNARESGLGNSSWRCFSPDMINVLIVEVHHLIAKRRFDLQEIKTVIIITCPNSCLGLLAQCMQRHLKR